MKSKKLISLLCAAAMTTSAFAGLVTTASAAETTLWSDTFDGYTVPDTTYGDWCTDVLIQGSGNNAGQYKEIDGIALQVGGRTGGDDSTYWSLHQKEGTTDNYLSTATGRFSTINRGAKLLFNTEYKATADQDLVMDFDWMTTDCRDINCTYDRAFAITGKNVNGVAVTTLVDKEDAGIEFDSWTDVRAVVTPEGTNVYVGENETPIATSDATSITGLDFSAYINGVAGKEGEEYRIDGKPEGYPVNSFDNVVVYNTSAGEGLTSTAPEPETHDPAEVDYVYAPKGEAPEGLGIVSSDDFNSSTAERLIYIGEDGESTYTDLNTVTLRVGPANDATGNTNWSITKNTGSAPTVADNVLIANNFERSTANRGPKMEFKKGEIAERETVVAYFATKLNASETSPAEVIFSGDLVASDSKGNIASPIAMITTDADADSAAYASANPIDKGGANVIEVESGKWALVKIEAYRSEGKTAGAKISVTVDDNTTYIFGSADEYAEMRDSTKKGITTLPFVTFRSGNDGDYGVSNTTNEIDNIAVYSSSITATPQPKHNVTVTYDGTDKATVSTTETEAFDAVMAIAKYDSEGVLLSVDTEDVKGISSAAGVEVAVGAMNNGDQLLVWNSLKDMIPYGSLVITNGGTQPVAITGTVEVSGTAKVGETLTAAVANSNAETLKYQWQANTGADGAYEDIADATAETFVVTEDLVGKTIKVVVTADGYIGSIKSVPTAAVEAADEEQDEITGTVTVSGTAKVGETLTAAVADSNATEFKYQWQANTGADGAYENIADATAETFVVTEDLVGKTIKVVVTADRYDGLIESAPTAEVVAADEEPVEAPTVETATLHDTAGVVQDNELYTEGSYKVTTTAETGYTNVAIAAENLKKHQNADTPESVGYWVGAKVTAPTDTKITGYYFSKDAYEEGTSQFTDCDENEISFYTNVGDANQKIWAAVKLSDNKVYVYKLDTTGVKVFEEAVPYAEGTITYDDVDDVKVFTEVGRVTGSLETTALNGNATKVEQLAANGGKARAKYVPYSGDELVGENITVSYDVTFPARVGYMNIIGGDYTGSSAASEMDDGNAVTKKIVTVGCETNTNELCVYEGTTKVDIAGTDGTAKWYHVVAKINATTKKVSLSIYDYKANNNYENETAVYDKELDFRDTNVTGVSGLTHYSLSNESKVQIDNIYINDPSYVTPIDVTVTAPEETDGTLKVDKTKVRADDVITITATPAAGKKVTAVKVNGVAVTYNDGYKYTVTGEEDAIVVTAEFARADAATVEVAGASSVQKGETAQYTATIKDDAGTVLAGDVEWTVEGAQDTSNTKIENGLLTVGADETASTLTVKAATKKDVANEEDETKVEGTATVTVATEAVYNVTKGTETNGTFTVSATQATEGTEITIVPSPAEGYQVKEVSYSKTEDGSEKQVVSDNSGYKFNAPAYNVTVNVEFEAISYTITDETVEENGNSVTIKVDGSEAATATVGQTVTIEPTVAQGYKVDTVIVMNGEQPVEVSNNTFTMPAANVTVTVTFVAWDGIYGNVNFDSEEVATISGNSSKEIATAVGTWKVGGTSSSSQTKILTIADDNTLNTGFTTGSGNCFQGWGNNTHEYLEMTSEVSPVTNNGIKISFDMYFGAVAGIGDAYLSIGDQTPANALLHLVANSNTNYTNITVGAEDTLNAQEIYYYDPEASIYKSTGIATGSAINVVETINADGTATVELKSGENTKNFTIKVSPTTSVGRFNVQGVRISGSAKGTALIALDNVLVTAPWYTAE